MDELAGYPVGRLLLDKKCINLIFFIKKIKFIVDMAGKKMYNASLSNAQKSKSSRRNF